MGDISSGSELLLYPFLVIKAFREAPIFILEFSKDGSSDLEDEFEDGGVADQPGMLQGGVSPVARCLSIFASFSPTCNGFLKLVTDFLMR